MINLNDAAVKLCLSFITMNVAEIGLKRVQESWNSHPIKG